jgi:hypothetical protein
MDDLRKVIRQSGATLEPDHTDYELHGTLVAQAEQHSRTSRQMQKMLERKYRRWIQATSAISDPDELLKFWKNQLRAGEVAGPFWALVTHPHTDVKLMNHAYGEVHMLSHLQGASNRGDRQRLHQLAVEIDTFTEKFERQRQRHQSQLTQRDQLIHTQTQELRSLKSRMETTRPQRNNNSVKKIESERDLNQRHLARTEERLAQREMELDQLQHEMAALKETLKESRDEQSALEESLAQLLSCRNKKNRRDSNHLNLDGQRVLYVGGRSTLKPHLRSLVESSNGRFAYHDGGLEESRANLHCSLAGADMIFCPVDCVSHDACRRVKRYCRQQAKPFIPLRSAGLSAFAAGLRLSTQDPTTKSADRQLAHTNAFEQ